MSFPNSSEEAYLVVLGGLKAATATATLSIDIPLYHRGFHLQRHEEITRIDQPFRMIPHSRNDIARRLLRAQNISTSDTNYLAANYLATLVMRARF